MKKIIAILGLVTLVATASSAVMRVGVEDGIPYMGWQLTEMQALDVGLGYTSTNDGNNTNLNLFGKYTQNIVEAKNVKLNWSGTLGLASTKQAAGVASATWTTISLIGSLGAEYMINDVIAIYGDIDLLMLQSMSGDVTGTNIWLVTGSGNCYSGIRIYI
ncbi:MAG: hypothetical protein JW782_01495 [Candidatus Saganbacteria bacterium]|nr:hypothetical protein [Candidatus Saganbacteria bacterium]